MTNSAYKAPLPGISPLGQLGILIGLIGVGFILAAVVTIAVPLMVLHIPVADLQSAILDPKNIQVTRFIQFASTFFLFAVPAWLMALIVYRKPAQYLGFATYSTARQFFIILLLVIASLFAQSILSQLNEMIPISKSLAQYFKQKEDDYSKEILAMAQMKTATDYLYAMLILAFLPALFEELFFRGAMQQTLIRLFRSTAAGIIVTSILFSAAHLSYYGFLTRFFLGILLGYIFHYGKNIWLNITTHFLNNAVVVTGLYMLSRSGKLTDKSLDDTPQPFYIGILAIAAVIALFVVFKRESMKSVQVADIATEEKIVPAGTSQENSEPLL